MGQYSDPSTLFTYLAAPPPGCAFDLPRLLPRAWANRFHAANTIGGAARLRALGRLETRLLRDSVPVTALHEVDALDVFADRVGCTQPRGPYGVEVGALCLRR